jgi:hypothetical protein
MKEIKYILMNIIVKKHNFIHFICDSRGSIKYLTRNCLLCNSNLVFPGVLLLV